MSKNNRKEVGFTLIELLIVVAIIAILAAIAIPNFLQAQIRSKVARAKADMRSIATALESYAVDNTVYPSALYSSKFSNFNDRYYNVTTPIAYITSVPLDPFALHDQVFPFPQNAGTAGYEYEDRQAATNFNIFDGNPDITNMPNYDRFFNPNNQWYLLSAGPDAKNTYQFGTPVTVPAGQSNAVNLYTYDPSNGTVSNGDIWRYGP